MGTRPRPSSKDRATNATPAPRMFAFRVTASGGEISAGRAAECRRQRLIPAARSTPSTETIGIASEIQYMVSYDSVFASHPPAPATTALPPTIAMRPRVCMVTCICCCSASL